VLRDTEPLVESGDVNYAGCDFSRGENLGSLRRWLHMRQYMQIDKIDERVGIEVATTIALLMLLPPVMALVVNLVFVKATVWREQALNLQVAWTMICTLGVVIHSLTVTLNLNDLFEGHKNKLEALQEKMRISKAFEQHELAVKAQAGVDITPSDFETHPSMIMVKTVLENLRKFDRPATLFGFTVNRKVVAGYVVLTLGSTIPEVLVIFQQFFREITRSI